MLSQNKMYQTIYFDERVALTPLELNRIASPDDDHTTVQSSIKNIIEEKLQKKHEGICGANGYVRKASVKLITKSMGVCENGRFTGNFLYDCKVSADVYYPVANSLVDVRVLKINTMGAYTILSSGGDDVDEAMQVIIPRDLHPSSPEFEAIEPNQIIKIRLLRCGFQINDRFIVAVGRLYDYEVSKGIKVDYADSFDDSDEDDSDGSSEADEATKPAKDEEEDEEVEDEEDA